MHIKVSAGFSGKIPTGPFQNSAPSFFAEVEFDSELKGEALERDIDATQKRLHAIAYQNFNVVAESAKIEKIKADLKGFRFYPTANGEYPSVTTIIDPDYKPFVGEDELAIATAEGNICHARAAHFIKTGEWVDPKALDGVAPDLLLLKGRFLDAWYFPGMLKKFPMKDLKNGRVLVNHTHRYAGTNDAQCLYPLGGEKDAEMVPTIIDFKRTADKHKNFTQMAGYAKCEGMEDIVQMMIIQTNTDTQQGFSKPIISTAVDKYFEVFVDKREAFRATYGV
jgi:hypothetical protein